MNTMREELIKTVNSTLAEFLGEYGQSPESPFMYFYEEDARADLYARLLNAWPYKVNGLTWEGHERDIPKGFNTSPFKAEYPQSGNKRWRFDIAYIENIGTNFYELPVSVAIELKLGSDKLGSDQCAGFKLDIEKLKLYGKEKAYKHFLGIAVYLYQTVPQDKKDMFNRWFKEFKWDQVPCDELRLKDNTITAIVAYPNVKRQSGNKFTEISCTCIER